MTFTGWILYALAVGALISAAGWCLDRGLARARLPTRWVWAAALFLSVSIPAGAVVSGGAPAPETEPAASLLAVDAWTGTGTASAQGAEGAAAALRWPSLVLPRVSAWVNRTLDRGAAALPSGGGLERWMAALWIGSSIALAIVLVIVGLLVTRRRELWPRLELRGRPVRVAPKMGPAVVGIVSPEIVLPRWATALEQEELELVLAHEGEHLLARDPLLLAGGLASVLLAPWNPVFWWQLRKLREAVEVDCDRRVLRGGVSPRRYGSLLVRLGTRVQHDIVPSPALCGASSSLLMRRLNAMKKARARGAVPMALLGGAAATGLLVLACEADTPTAPPSVAGAGLTEVRSEEETGLRDEAVRLVREAAEIRREAEAAGDERPDAGPTRLLGALREVADVVYSDADSLDADSDPGGPPAPEEEASFEDAPPPASDEQPAPTAASEPPQDGSADPGTSTAEGTPQPTFTPFEVAPDVRNRAQVQQALQAEYPSLLRDAGIGGTVIVWFFINETGEVEQVQINESSGHAQLDQAALSVAGHFEFTPALNRDQRVPVWVQIPITFQTR